MNFAKRDKSIVDFIFIIALFGMFAITGLFVVLFGARVYQSTVAGMDANYSSRTALSYITEKIRSHDYTDGVLVTNAVGDDNSVLMLYENVNDRRFVTYMFVDDGYLKEYTAGEDYDFHYDDGMKILKMDKFKVTKIEDSLYGVEITDEYGEDINFFVTLYSGTDGEDTNE